MGRSPSADRCSSVDQVSSDIEDHIDITMYGLPLYPPSMASSGASSPSRYQYPTYSTPLLGQMYRREGPAHQQRTTWFGGQYCTTYGLDDPLPAFQENDPFAWQVERIETARAAFGVQHHLQVQTQAQMKVELQAEMRRQQLEKARMQAQVRSRLLGRGETHGMMSQGEDFMAARAYFERETGYTQDDDHHKDEGDVRELRVPPSTPEWVLAQPTQIGTLSDLRAMMDGASLEEKAGDVGAISSAGNVDCEHSTQEYASDEICSPATYRNETASGRGISKGTFTLPGLPSASSGSMPNMKFFDDATTDGNSLVGRSSDGSPVEDPASSPHGSPSAESGATSDATNPDSSVPRSTGFGMAHQLQSYLQRRDPGIAIASDDHLPEAAADPKSEADSETATDEEPSTPEVKATCMTLQEYFWEEMRAYTRGEGPKDPREPLLPFVYLEYPQTYQNYQYVPVEHDGDEEEDSEDSESNHEDEINKGDDLVHH